jgi:hypothetical protein
MIKSKSGFLHLQIGSYYPLALSEAYKQMTPRYRGVLSWSSGQAEHIVSGLQMNYFDTLICSNMSVIKSRNAVTNIHTS